MRYISLSSKEINSLVSKFLRTEKDDIIKWINHNKSSWSRFNNLKVDEIMIANISMSIQIDITNKQKTLLKRKRIGLTAPTEDYIRDSVTKKLPKFIEKHF
jgi:hypothetical protein